MNFVIKSMIFNGLNAKYPGAISILIDVKDKNALVQYADQRHVNEKIGESKHIDMLAEFYGMKFVNTIYVDVKKKVIAIRGDKDVVIN